MARQSYWTNNDGIKVGFGGQVSGNYDPALAEDDDALKTIVMKIVAGSLQASGTAVTDNQAYIPSGAFIVDAKVDCTTTFDQAIDVGTMQVDGTAIDANGLVAAATPTAATTTTGAGALIGTKVSQASYLCAAANTTAPTAGSAELVVRYRMPTL